MSIDSDEGVGAIALGHLPCGTAKSEASRPSFSSIAKRRLSVKPSLVLAMLKERLAPGPTGCYRSRSIL